VGALFEGRENFSRGGGGGKKKGGGKTGPLGLCTPIGRETKDPMVGSPILSSRERGGKDDL